MAHLRVRDLGVLSPVTRAGVLLFLFPGLSPCVWLGLRVRVPSTLMCGDVALTDVRATDLCGLPTQKNEPEDELGPALNSDLSKPDLGNFDVHFSA